MFDWATFADFATAIGTTLLAAATFLATRSANRSARSAERALLEGLRPILLPSNWSDAPQKVRFMEGKWLLVHGGRAVFEVTDQVIFIVMSVRNAGSGLAVLNGWSIPADGLGPPAPTAQFHRLTRDIYVPTSGPGFCQIAVRDPQSEYFARIREQLRADDSFMVDVLYSDAEGTQNVISRFLVSRVPAEYDDNADEYILTVARHWNLDLPSPRS